MVQLNTEVKKIEVFYDSQCGMCRVFMDWLVKRKRACELLCMDYRGKEAGESFPELADYRPEKEMVVRVDGEVVYQGAEGWLWCLWACARYRVVAKLVNNRFLLPVTKKLCGTISGNRMLISRFLFRKKDGGMRCEGGCGK